MKKRDFNDHSLYPDVTGQIIRVWKIAKGAGPFFDLAKFLHNRDEIRIVEATDNTTTMADLKGDLFNRSAHPDLDPKKLEEEEKEFNLRVEREGVTGIIGLVWNRDNEDWDLVDNIYGFVGSDWLESEYDLEMLESVVAAAKERGFEGQEDFEPVKEKKVGSVDDVIRLMERGHRVLMPIEKYSQIEKELGKRQHKDKLMFWNDEERPKFVRAFLLEASRKVLGNPRNPSALAGALKQKKISEMLKNTQKFFFDQWYYNLPEKIRNGLRRKIKIGRRISERLRPGESADVTFDFPVDNSFLEVAYVTKEDFKSRHGNIRAGGMAGSVTSDNPVQHGFYIHIVQLPKPQSIDEAFDQISILFEIVKHEFVHFLQMVSPYWGSGRKRRSKDRYPSKRVEHKAYLENVIHALKMHASSLHDIPDEKIDPNTFKRLMKNIGKIAGARGFDQEMKKNLRLDAYKYFSREKIPSQLAKKMKLAGFPVYVGAVK